MNKHSAQSTFRNSRLPLALAMSLSIAALSGCSDGGGSSDEPVASGTNDTVTAKTFTVLQGNDLNTKANALLSANPGGPGGSPNQSLRAADMLQGGSEDDLIIGALGADVLIGAGGDDILIGGTEDFNSSVDGDNRGADNRDRAFGNAGNDTFIWSPGDGSDFFDGGEGNDVVIFGLLGEQRNAAGETEGAPFFAVSPPGSEGSQDFDGIFVTADYQPRVNVSGSPGFCSLVDPVAHADALERLNVDQIVRFSLRGVANQFDAGERTDDDGLRVAITLKNVEFVVCTQRDVSADGGLANVEVLDLRSGVPLAASIADLPAYVQDLIL